MTGENEENRNDAHIDTLRRRIEALEQQNTSLTNDLESKGKKLESIHKKVRALESENKNSKATIKTLRNEKKTLEREVQSLKTTIEKQKEEIESLCIEIKRLTAQMDCLEQEKEEQQTQISKLRGELQETTTSLKTEIEDLKLAQEERRKEAGKGEEEAVAGKRVLGYIVLREMCRQLQNGMYKKVFPDNFIDDDDFTVEMIEQDIKYEEDEDERQKANDRWENLKETLQWKDVYKDTIRCIVGQRNYAAHQQSFTKASLRSDLAKMKLPKKGVKSPDKVERLIDMWVCCQ